MTRSDIAFNANSANTNTTQRRIIDSNDRPETPIFRLQYKRRNSSVWHTIEIPLYRKAESLRELLRYSNSPLQTYLYCEFRVLRLKDNHIMATCNHRSIK